MPESAAAHESVKQPEQRVTPQAPERWRAPAAVSLKALASAAAGIVLAAVFFPLWVAVPVAVLLAVWGAGMCLRPPVIVLDAAPPGQGPDGGAPGLLTVRLGPVTRRVAVSQIEAVVLDQGKVTIGKTDKSAISFYAWRKSRLDAWLKVPDVASDVAHAISRAATAAQAGSLTETPRTPKTRRTANSPLIALACAGVLEIAAALVTRVSWGNPVMTAAGIIVALAFGFTGIGTLVFTLWTFLTASRRKPPA